MRNALKGPPAMLRWAGVQPQRHQDWSGVSTTPFGADAVAQEKNDSQVFEKAGVACSSRIGRASRRRDKMGEEFDGQSRMPITVRVYKTARLRCPE